MPEPLTGLAAELGLTLGDAATRKGAEFWRRNHEGDKLVRKVAARVKADAAVHHSVREPLAKLLPDKLRTEPQAQGALALLLDGERMDAAAAALAQVTV